jgi:hypothetical protein
MDRASILIDHETGLFVGWYFWLRVLDEVNRDARYGAPFGLLLLTAGSDKGVSRRAVDDAAARVAGAIRSTDVGGALGPGHVGVLLLQQDEQSAPMAAQRILGRLEASMPAGLGWDSRLYVYPRDAAEISDLLTARSGSRPERSRLPA